jgi:hypothetical protein
MSGVCLANSERATEHALRYSFVACVLRLSPVPYIRLVLAISLFAALQFSSNHGARVLPHLLGFLGVVMLIHFTTPAYTAYSSKNCSTLAARLELSIVVSSTIFLNSSIKSGWSVKLAHYYADFA